MANHTVDAQPRTEFGNGPSRRLRKEGLVPGVLYQKPGDALPICVNERELRRVLFSADGRTSVVALSIAGGPAQPAVLTEWQLDPVRGAITHVDFRPAAAEEISSGVVERAAEHIEAYEVDLRRANEPWVDEVAEDVVTDAAEDESEE
jgi:ribosomal protein L25 (general stress protein Ctc)